MKLRNPLRDVRTIQTLLKAAEAEAHAAGAEEPGAEHLLLAALDLPDGTARSAFQRAGSDPEALRAAIETQHDDALRAVGVATERDPGEAAAPVAPAVYRSGASAQAAFQAASELARSERGSQLAGAHVVVAVARMEHGTAARALRVMGVDRDALAKAALDELAARRS